MKKAVYIVCLCLLTALLTEEGIRTYREGEAINERAVFTPTARFSACVREENEKEKSQENEKCAYLTFDDGPSANTEKILKTLSEKKVTATFFLIGNEITKDREEIVKKEMAQGHAVGVHTFCHEQELIYCDEESFFEDYRKTADRIYEVTGKIPDLHRFPWGSNNGYVCACVDVLHEKLSKMGVKSFDWNVSGEDSVGKNVDKETIFQNIKKDVTRYDRPIILLHDSSAMDNTAAILGKIIDYIREKGYSFDTLENREEYLFPEAWRK